LNPVILYDNRFEDGALSATDTESGFDVNNIKDLRPHSFWKAASYGTKYITEAPLAKGTVTLADMRLSLLDGSAFVDFSAADVLTDHIGKRLVVIDSAGKKAIGYIKAASANTPSSVLKICASPSVVYASWENNGIWEHNGDGWVRIHATNPIGMTAGASLLFASFSGNGLWKYDGTTWTKLNTDEPTVMSAYGTLLFYAYNTNKAYEYDTATDTRTEFASSSVVNVISAGDDVVYMNIVGQGAWRYVPSTSTWTDTSGADVDKLWTMGALTYGTFPGFAKTYQYAGSVSSWNVIHNSIMASAGAVVNNATLYCALSDGIYQWVSGTTWTKISSDVPTKMTGTASKLYAYFDATKTLKSWDGANWVTILSPSDTGVTITSTPDGSTYNWESIEAGFNYNDSSGYAYKISESDACDALFLFGHNLGTAEASVSVESTDDEVTWTERLAVFQPADDRAIMKLLTSFRAASKRLKIDTESLAPYIAIAMLGQRMEFPFPPDSPYDPYNIGIESESELSVQGNHLGDVIYYYPIAQRVVFSNPLRSFITDTYKPFWDTHGRLRKSFAWAWDLTAYPDVVYFMKLTKNARLSMPLSVGTYADTLVLDMEGVAEP